MTDVRIEDSYSLSTPYAGAGKLLGFIASHAESTAQTLALYDDDTGPAVGTCFLTVIVAPEQSPFFIWFPRPIPFTTGLYAAMTNFALYAWIVPA